jgi:hypothetical protein
VHSGESIDRIDVPRREQMPAKKTTKKVAKKPVKKAAKKKTSKK